MKTQPEQRHWPVNGQALSRKENIPLHQVQVQGQLLQKDVNACDAVRAEQQLLREKGMGKQICVESCIRMTVVLSVRGKRTL